MPMPTRVTKVFAVTDAKIHKLLTDPAGGAPTYGPPIDVPGIKSLAISGSVSTKQLRGDNQLLDQDTVLTDVSITVTNAKLSFDVLGLLLDLTPAESGVTPNQILNADLLGTSRPSYFKLSAVSASADVIGGNVAFDIHKAILSSFPDLGLAEEDYQTTGFQAAAVPLLGNGKWISTSLNETARVLA